MSISQTMDRTAVTAGSTITGFGKSYAITSIFSALLVILKELSPAVHDGLAAILGHHWVTHGALNVILFVVLGIVLSKNTAEMPTKSLITTVIGSTIVSGLIIAGFFLIVG